MYGSFLNSIKNLAANADDFISFKDRLGSIKSSKDIQKLLFEVGLIFSLGDPQFVISDGSNSSKYYPIIIMGEIKEKKLANSLKVSNTLSKNGLLSQEVVKNPLVYNVKKDYLPVSGFEKMGRSLDLRESIGEQIIILYPQNYKGLLNNSNFVKQNFGQLDESFADKFILYNEFGHVEFNSLGLSKDKYEFSMNDTKNATKKVYFSYEQISEAWSNARSFEALTKPRDILSYIIYLIDQRDFLEDYELADTILDHCISMLNVRKISEAVPILQQMNGNIIGHSQLILEMKNEYISQAVGYIKAAKAQDK